MRHNHHQHEVTEQGDTFQSFPTNPSLSFVAYTRSLLHIRTPIKQKNRYQNMYGHFLTDFCLFPFSLRIWLVFSFFTPSLFCHVQNGDEHTSCCWQRQQQNRRGATFTRTFVFFGKSRARSRQLSPPASLPPTRTHTVSTTVMRKIVMWNRRNRYGYY